MYVIVVYDVEQKRVSRVCNYLRRHLHWVQNSAFEGELTESRLAKVKAGLGRIIDPRTDSVYFYVLPDRRWLNRQVLGQAKNLTDNVL